MNTILLFKEKKLINEDIFVNHPTFHFGRIIYYSHDVFNVEFLNLGVKKILKTHINRLLSMNVMSLELADYIFASKYIKVNDVFGKIVETYSNRVIAEFGDRKEEFKLFFDASLSKVEFDFTLINEDEYKKHIATIEEKIKKENEKYLGIKVDHVKYGIGEVINCENDKVTIRFNEKTTKFSIDYLLNSMNILNPNDKVKKVEKKEEKVISLNFNVGDILSIPHFGRLFVIDYKPNEYIKFENIDSNIFGYNIEWLKEEYKLKNIDENYSYYNLVYNEIYGYCVILGISKEGFDLYKIYDNTIVSLKIKYLKLLEKVVDDRLSNLFKIGFKGLVRINNIIGTIIKYGKNTFEVYSITDNQYIEFKYTEVKDVEIINYAYNHAKSYKGAIYSTIDKVLYTKDNLLKICTDAIKFFPVEDNIKIIKNNANALIRKSGFLLIDKLYDIYIDERYKGLEEYLTFLSVKEDFVYKDNMLDSQYYEYLLTKLCKQHLIVQLYENKYITIKKLSELGINLFSFDDFKNKVYDCIANLSFVTINQIREYVDSDLCNIFSDDNVLINLIKTYDIFKTYKLGNKYVLSIKNENDRNESIEKMFISLFTSNNCKSMDIYDLLYMINESFDFDFTIESLLFEMKNFEVLYYSKETERVYINKNQFYKEIYE